MSKNNKHKDYENKVQLDGDPMERKDEAGKLRMGLNSRERRELAERKHVAKAVELLAANRELPDIAKELGVDPSVLAHDMLYGENPEAKIAVFNQVVKKLLDLNKGRTRTEMAEEIGITHGQLEHLLRKSEFREHWAEQFVALREDPNIQAVQKIVVEDLLPEALRTLKAELSADAPWTVRQNARRDIFKLAGVEAVQAEQSDRAAAAAFLEKYEITIIDGRPQAPIPAAYLEAMKDYLPDVVDGEVKEVDQSS